MFRFIIFLILILIAYPSHATRINVSSSAQITTAMATAAPGDTLVMQNGVWSNQLINFGGANGVFGNPIVLIAQTPGAVLLEGTSRLRIYGNYLEVNGLLFQNCNATSFGTNSVVEFRNGSVFANYSRLTNTYIMNYNSLSSVDNKWVSLYGTNNKLDYCRFEGKVNYGATVTVWYVNAGGFPNESPSTYHIIDHNHFLNRTLPLGGNGGESIRIGDSNTSRTNGYNIISNNLFDNCDGEIEVISNKSEFNTYEYNTFIGNAGGLTLRHGASCTIRGNFFFGDGDPLSAGVRIIDGLHTVYNNYFQDILGGSNGSLRAPIVVMNGQTSPAANGYWPVYNSTITNNTMVNCSAPSINIGSSSSGGTIPPNNVKISNNIIYSTFGPLVKYTTVPTNMTYEGNMYFGAALGDPPVTGWSNTNPLLTFNSGSFRLSSNSPAINASVGIYPPTTDYDGQNRTGINDIGCDEYSTAQITIEPLNSDQVGVCWLSNGNIPCLLLQGPLPLELLSFNCIYSNGKTKVIWQTANEKKILNYTLEYSTNYEQWEDVASRLPSEKLLNEYTAEHSPKKSGTLYYRLKINELDGSVQYSKIIVVQKPSQNIEVFPTMCSKNASLHVLAEAGISQISIYALTGQLLYSKKINDPLLMDIIDIPDYLEIAQWIIINIQCSNNTTKHFKVFIQ